MNVEHVRKRLKEEREKILAKAKLHLANGKFSVEDAQDSIDRAVSSYEKEYAFSLSIQEQQTLDKIEEALRRIERGEYGKCLICGNPIPSRRLQAVPWATLCIACKEKEEMGLLP